MQRIFAYLSMTILVLFAVNCVAQQQPDLQKVIPAFQAYAERYMPLTQTPGMAIAIVQNDKVVYAKGFGVRKVGAKAKVDIHTIFQIGSMSKAFTTALMAMLVDDNKVKWDDHVIEYMPIFRMYDPWVTREFRIEDLFAQYSGLKSHAGDFQVFVGSSREDIIKSLRYMKPIASFRSKYAYQNTLFLVAAAVEEAVTQQTWEKLLQTRIFKPLGMKKSSASLAKFLKARNKAWIHHAVFGKATAYPKNWPFLDWVYTYGPAGGINSNIVNMSKWLMLQMNNGKYKGKQLITTDSIERMHRPHIFAAKFFGADEYYAMGWVYRPYSPHPVIWHNGETSGAHNMMAFIPQSHIGIVILTNTNGNGHFPEALAFQFFDMYFGKPDKDWVKGSVDTQKQSEAQQKAAAEKPSAVYSPASLKQYVGKYHNSIYGDVAVSQEGKNLMFNIGAKRVKIVLKPYKSGIFSVYCTAMDLAGETKAVFNVDQSGKVITMNVEFLEQDSDGKFTRVNN